MAVNVANCTNITQAYIYCDKVELDYASLNYTTGDIIPGILDTENKRSFGVIKFKTPNVPSAISQYLTFDLDIYSYSNGFKMKYAICTSDANYKLYHTYGNVSDEYQIVSGELSTSNLVSRHPNGTFIVFEFDNENLKPNTFYYLFLWAATSSGSRTVIDPPSGHKIKMGFIQGVVQIDNGSTFEAYQCCIYNGTSWDIYTPYIDNGTSWDVYS